MLRDAWLHKARTLLVVVAIAIGMIGAGALLDAWALVQRVTATTYRASHPVSATLRVDAVDATLLGAGACDAGDRRARARGARVSAAADANGTRQTAELFALDDFEARDIGHAASRARQPGRRAMARSCIERSSLEFSGATSADRSRCRSARIRAAHPAGNRHRA